MATGQYSEAERLVVRGRGRQDLNPAIQALKTGDADMVEGISDILDRARVWLLMELPDRALDALDGYVLDPPFQGKTTLFAPWADPIRDDPRFQAVLAQMGLEGVEPVRAPPLGDDRTGTMPGKPAADQNVI
jgi:hypothetical protein